MTLLQKLGSVAASLFAMVTGFTPLVNKVIPASGQPEATKIEDGIDTALNTVITAEQMFTAAGQGAKTGSLKLQAAAPYVAKLIQNATVLSGKTPKDTAKFTAAVNAITGGFADVLNSYGD